MCYEQGIEDVCRLQTQTGWKGERYGQPLPFPLLVFSVWCVCMQYGQFIYGMLRVPFLHFSAFSNGSRPQVHSCFRNCLWNLTFGQACSFLDFWIDTAHSTRIFSRVCDDEGRRRARGVGSETVYWLELCPAKKSKPHSEKISGMKWQISGISGRLAITSDKRWNVSAFYTLVTVHSGIIADVLEGTRICSSGMQSLENRRRHSRNNTQVKRGLHCVSQERDKAIPVSKPKQVCMSICPMAFAPLHIKQKLRLSKNFSVALYSWCSWCCETGAHLAARRGKWCSAHIVAYS